MESEKGGNPIVRYAKEIYRFRRMFFETVKKDFKGPYRNTLLGYLWHVIAPVMSIAVYVMIFSDLLRNMPEFFWIYVSTGMFPWIFFSASLGSSANSIVRNGNMVKKMYFPREILIMSGVTTQLIGFIISYTLLIACIFFSGFPLHAPGFLLLPVIILLETGFTYGLCLLFSAANVYIRDISHGVSILTHVWMWMTPIIYVYGTMSPFVNMINQLNPLTYFINAFHDIVYYGTIPELMNLMICIELTIISIFVGIYAFKKLENGFAERI